MVILVNIAISQVNQRGRQTPCQGVVFVFASVNVPENLALAVNILNENAPFYKGFVMGFIRCRKRFAFLLLDGQNRILVVAVVHPLASRIRQQQGIGVQQQVVTAKSCCRLCRPQPRVWRASTRK